LRILRVGEYPSPYVIARPDGGEEAEAADQARLGLERAEPLDDGARQ
jgi:hypothetical protein